MSHYQKLKEHFSKLSHFNYIQRILMWDEATLMPEGAGAYRAESVAILNQAIQKLLVSKKVGRLLDLVKSESLLSSWDVANLQWMNRKYISANCVSSKLVAKSTKAILLAFQAWKKCRDQNNWNDFKPYLEKSFSILREIAERKSEALSLHPYDVMLDSFSPGMNQENLDKIFTVLRNRIPELRQRILAKQGQEHLDGLGNFFPIKKQSELGELLLKKIGFDFNHGRLDTSHHPFCDGVPIDIRITTRYNEYDFIESLFGIIHEAGHALYEQGMPKEWISQPVGQTQNKSLHESQSLLFEYEVGHSIDFLEFLSEKVRSVFDVNENFSAIHLYEQMTRVRTDLIRVNADEVSYSLHVILRYEIEKKLFQDEITVADLPAIWNEKMLQYFGVSTDGNNRDGVMQDMHWSWGYFGYFPSYTIGQLMASQFYSTFLKCHPEFGVELTQGNFNLLNQWLKKNIYSAASSLSAEKLLLHVTGEPLNPEYFLQKMEGRYQVLL